MADIACVLHVPLARSFVRSLARFSFRFYTSRAPAYRTLLRVDPAARSRGYGDDKNASVNGRPAAAAAADSAAFIFDLDRRTSDVQRQLTDVAVE